MNAINRTANGLSNTLGVAALCTTNMEAFDKFSKAVKTAIGILEELSKEMMFYVPIPLLNVKGVITSANSVNSLLQPGFRYSEWKTDHWKKEENTGLWRGTGAAYRSKVLLSAGVSLEAIRVLQSTFVLPTTAHLFTIAARYPFFQSIGTHVQALPYGAFISDFVMKFTGLEIIKNAFIVGSAYYGYQKSSADINAANARIEKITQSIGKWKDRKKTADRQVGSLTIFMTFMWRRKGACISEVVSRTNAITQQPDGVANFFRAQLDRLKKKKNAAKADLDKATRGKWNEIFKVSVIVFASVTGVYGLMAKPFIKGAFTVVAATGASFGLWKVIADANAENAKKEAGNVVPTFESLFKVTEPDQSAPNDKTSELQLSLNVPLLVESVDDSDDLVDVTQTPNNTFVRNVPVEVTTTINSGDVSELFNDNTWDTDLRDPITSEYPSEDDDELWGPPTELDLHGTNTSE